MTVRSRNSHDFCRKLLQVTRDDVVAATSSRAPRVEIETQIKISDTTHYLVTIDGQSIEVTACCRWGAAVEAINRWADGDWNGAI